PLEQLIRFVCPFALTLTARRMSSGQRRPEVGAVPTPTTVPVTPISNAARIPSWIIWNSSVFPRPANAVRFFAGRICRLVSGKNRSSFSELAGTSMPWTVTTFSFAISAHPSRLHAAQMRERHELLQPELRHPLRHQLQPEVRQNGHTGDGGPERRPV